VRLNPEEAAAVDFALPSRLEEYREYFELRKDMTSSRVFSCVAGSRTFHADRVEALAPYQVNAALMSQAKSDALFMHCLPAHREEEVTAEVIDGPQSVVFEQAENCLHVAKAILIRLLSGV